MAYTAQQLITRSWYLSGIVARNLQIVTGDQITDGLMMLNSLLDFKQIEIDLIPYWTYIELTAVPGQEFYFLPNVAAVESLTFNINNVRYPTENTTRTTYYATSRVDNIQTLPFNWNFNRQVGGGTIGLYFLPDQAYPLKMMVKIFLTDVQLTTDLTNIPTNTNYTYINTTNIGYDTSYIEYLRYELANYMCNEYGIMLNPPAMETLISYRRKLMDVSPPDLKMVKSTILAGNSQGYNYGDINIGRGFRPS